MRPLPFIATPLVLTALALSGCGAADTGARITEVQEHLGFTVAYVEIAPARAKLPWTLLQDQVWLVQGDGQKTTLAGISPKGALAMGLAGLKLSPGEGAQPLAFEVVHASQLLSVVAPLEREPRAGEIALVFKASRAGAVRVEATTGEGQQLTLPLP